MSVYFNHFIYNVDRGCILTQKLELPTLDQSGATLAISDCAPPKSSLLISHSVEVPICCI